MAPDVGDCAADPQVTFSQRLTLQVDPKYGPAAPIEYASPTSSGTVPGPAKVYTKQHGLHAIQVTNSSPQGIEDAVLCNTLTGRCTAPFSLAQGSSRSVSTVLRDLTGSSSPAGDVIPSQDEAVYDIIPTLISPRTGVQRGDPFRIIISCQRYELSGIAQDDNEISTVMRGGTSYRYFRVTDKITQTPQVGDTITVTMTGVNAVTRTYTTDQNGDVGSFAGGQWEPGVRIDFPASGGQEGRATVSLMLERTRGLKCGETTASYVVDFAPFESSHSVSAGSDIGGGLTIVGINVKAGGGRGLLARAHAEEGPTRRHPVDPQHRALAVDQRRPGRQGRTVRDEAASSARARPAATPAGSTSGSAPASAGAKPSRFLTSAT